MIDDSESMWTRKRGPVRGRGEKSVERVENGAAPILPLL